MGTELARHLLADHTLTVWNRTASRTKTLADLGAQVADSPEAAIENAEVVVSCLFGPDTVREVIVEPHLIPDGVPWIDATTVSPDDAAEFAEAFPSYVATPVVGTIGPAHDGTLGVYVGNSDPKLRDLAEGIVKPWADPERLRQVDSAPKAALGKLMANLALAISAQGFKEALLFADAAGLEQEEALAMLDSTGLGFIKNMKTPFVTGERDTDPGDFTANAIAKDVRFMLKIAEGSGDDGQTGGTGQATGDRQAKGTEQVKGGKQPDTADSGKPVLPTLHAALESFKEQQDAGRGNQDFSNILVHRNDKR